MDIAASKSFLPLDDSGLYYHDIGFPERKFLFDKS